MYNTDNVHISLIFVVIIGYISGLFSVHGIVINTKNLLLCADNVLKKTKSVTSVCHLSQYIISSLSHYESDGTLFSLSLSF